MPIAFISLIAAISITTFLGSPEKITANAFIAIGRPTRMAEDLEKFFSRNLSLSVPLKNLQLFLRTSLGQREIGNFFLVDDGLVQQFTPTEDSSLRKKNTKAIVEFAGREAVPAAVMLLPTPSAIYQEKLPPYAAEIQFNQHGCIEQIGKDFSGAIAAVDVYPTLFAARNDYLYYRTDSSLTTHGGYLVYKNLANRLGLVPIEEHCFHRQFLPTPYYGNLYGRWGYGGVKPDTIALYRYKDSSPLFTVHHWLRFEEKTYYSLFPSEADISGNPMDNILGGHSPRTDITNLSLSDSFGRLLILGDSNVLSFLPFLALHYSQITFADPDLLTESELSSIAPSDYSQVLFAFSLERYMNSSQPARAALAGTSLPQ